MFYKLSVMNDMGIEKEVYYFKTLNKAKKNFKKLVTQMIKSEDSATDQEEVIWTHSNKDDLDMYYSKQVRKEVGIPFHYDYETDCGTEYNIMVLFVRLENVEVIE